MYVHIHEVLKTVLIYYPTVLILCSQYDSSVTNTKHAISSLKLFQTQTMNEINFGDNHVCLTQ
jgi:hypothetical protein